MEFPLWAVFGLTAASFSAVFMLIQERLKINGFAMAFWNKAGCALFTLPLALYFGFPENWMFYTLVFGGGVIWMISDVQFFSAIPKVGAGTVSRVLPITIIISFFLWFLFDPALLQKYMAEPIKSVLLVVTLCASVFFATRLRHCPISWQAVRLLWFVLLASIIAPIAIKLITQQSPSSQGPFAYIFTEATFMVIGWYLWFLFKKPIPKEILFDPKAIKGGISIGAIFCLMLSSNFMAYSYIDNPALLSAVKFTDTVIILIVYKLTKRKEEADIVSGLGIVACAAVIVILKSMI